MSLGLESLAVGAIVLGAGVWAGNALRRALRGRQVCGSCAAGQDCPARKGGPAAALVQDLKPLPQDAAAAGVSRRPEVPD